jgi:hypothetical protein
MASETQSTLTAEALARVIEGLLQLAETQMAPGWAARDHRVLAGKSALKTLRREQ